MKRKPCFYGGKNGYDIICFNNQGYIVASGKMTEMLNYGSRNNFAVAKLIPIRFSIPVPDTRSKRILRTIK